MYDAGKIFIGLILGIILLLMPFWPTGGKWAAKAPEPELTPKAKEAKVCVESKSFMRMNHMKLLDQWRNKVVRKTDRIYISSSGKVFERSLQNTCMDCHYNKSKFCDKCHNWADVDPYCWQCHISPKENG